MCSYFRVLDLVGETEFWAFYRLGSYCRLYCLLRSNIACIILLLDVD